MPTIVPQIFRQLYSLYRDICIGEYTIAPPQIFSSIGVYIVSMQSSLYNTVHKDMYIYRTHIVHKYLGYTYRTQIGQIDTYTIQRYTIYTEYTTLHTIEKLYTLYIHIHSLYTLHHTIYLYTLTIYTVHSAIYIATDHTTYITPDLYSHHYTKHYTIHKLFQHY